MTLMAERSIRDCECLVPGGLPDGQEHPTNTSETPFGSVVLPRFGAFCFSLLLGCVCLCIQIPYTGRGLTDNLEWVHH